MANLKYDKEIAAPIKDDANVSWRLTSAAQFLGIGYPIIQAPFGRLPSHLTEEHMLASGNARKSWRSTYVSAVEVARCP